MINLTEEIANYISFIFEDKIGRKGIYWTLLLYNIWLQQWNWYEYREKKSTPWNNISFDTFCFLHNILHQVRIQKETIIWWSSQNSRHIFRINSIKTIFLFILEDNKIATLSIWISCYLSKSIFYIITSTGYNYSIHVLLLICFRRSNYHIIHF